MLGEMFIRESEWSFRRLKAPFLFQLNVQVELVSVVSVHQVILNQPTFVSRRAREIELEGSLL